MATVDSANTIYLFKKVNWEKKNLVLISLSVLVFHVSNLLHLSSFSAVCRQKPTEMPPKDCNVYQRKVYSYNFKVHFLDLFGSCNRFGGW